VFRASTPFLLSLLPVCLNHPDQPPHTHTYSGAARQRSSDQEVISFLDGRVQGLEAALQETAERLAAFKEETRRERAQLQEQQRVLRDMLAFERSQAEARGGEFRQQKRLLAKEVKSLRAELLLCQRERDAYRDDLRALQGSAALGGLGALGGGGVGGGGGRRR
jgi:chromosome segregation ATPase